MAELELAFVRKGLEAERARARRSTGFAVWFVLSAGLVALADDLSLFGALALLLCSLAWLAWAGGSVACAWGFFPAVMVALVAPDPRLAVLWWHAAMVLSVVLLAPAGFVNVEGVVLMAILAILAAVLVPVFAKAKQKSLQTACWSQERLHAQALRLYTADYDGWLPARDTPWTDAVTPYLQSAEGSPWTCPADQDGGLSYQFAPALRGRLLVSVPDRAATVLLFESDDGLTTAWRHNDGANVAYADGHVKWLACLEDTSDQPTASGSAP